MTPIIRKEKLIERLEKELNTFNQELSKLEDIYEETGEYMDYSNIFNLQDEIQRKERLIEVQKKKLKELKEGK